MKEDRRKGVREQGSGERRGIGRPCDGSEAGVRPRDSFWRLHPGRHSREDTGMTRRGLARRRGDDFEDRAGLLRRCRYAMSAS